MLNGAAACAGGRADGKQTERGAAAGAMAGRKGSAPTPLLYDKECEAKAETGGGGLRRGALVHPQQHLSFRYFS